MRLMGTDESALYLGKSERHSLFSDLHAENPIVEGCQVRDIDTNRLRAAVGGDPSLCGSGAGCAAAIDSRGGMRCWMNAAS
jgi:hypothetical protein